MHDDVFLPRNFIQRVEHLVVRLDETWPNWGLCGNAGVLSFAIGQYNQRYVRYLSDPHGGPNLQSMTLPVQSIDGNVMLLNAGRLREQKVTVPDVEGFQLYDVALSYAAIYSGLGVLVAPELSCYHDSKGSQESFDVFARSRQGKAVISDLIKNRYVQTLNGQVDAELRSYAISDSRADISLASLKSALKGRPVPRVAIVVRTQYRDRDLLSRTLSTASAFIAASGSEAEFEVFLVTEKQRPEGFKTGDAKVIQVEFDARGDSRNYLVKAAFESIDADWFWFLDDDDWLFPNEAELLSCVVSATPEEGLIFVGTQHFHEKRLPGLQLGSIGGRYALTPQRYFSPKDWHHYRSGHNHIPFSGMIVSKRVTRSFDSSIFEDVVYFEDFALQLSAIQSSRLIVSIDRLYVGISIRESGNTVTEKDRTKWNTSWAELTAKICNDPLRPYLPH